jgi:hypothetical protein
MRNCHSNRKNLLLYHFIKRVIRLIVIIIEGSPSYQPTYKIVSNVLLARLTPSVSEVIGDHQCGFCLNRSTTDQIFYIRQILEKKLEYNGAVISYL